MRAGKVLTLGTILHSPLESSHILPYKAFHTPTLCLPGVSPQGFEAVQTRWSESSRHSWVLDDKGAPVERANSPADISPSRVGSGQKQMLFLPAQTPASKPERCHPFAEAPGPVYWPVDKTRVCQTFWIFG